MVVYICQYYSQKVSEKGSLTLFLEHQDDIHIFLPAKSSQLPAKQKHTATSEHQDSVPLCSDDDKLLLPISIMDACKENNHSKTHGLLLLQQQYN
jgi:hypothetical protein